MSLPQEIVREFEYAGQLFAIPFELKEIDGVLTPIAWAHDIGAIFYDETDQRSASEKVNQNARKNSHIFDQPGYRTACYRQAVDGKRRKAWAYTKRGVVALGLLSRKEKAHRFVEFCIEVMEALLEGNTVKLTAPQPKSTLPQESAGLEQNIQMAQLILEGLKATAANQEAVNQLQSKVADQSQGLSAVQQQFQIEHNRVNKIEAELNKVKSINDAGARRAEEYTASDIARIHGIFYPTQSGGPQSQIVKAIAVQYGFFSPVKALARTGTFTQEVDGELRERTQDFFTHEAIDEIAQLFQKDFVYSRGLEPGKPRTGKRIVRQYGRGFSVVWRPQLATYRAPIKTR